MEFIEIKMKKRAIIISIKGLELSYKEKLLFRNEKPWGIILFKRNIKSLNQIKFLIKNIKELTKDKNFPILILTARTRWEEKVEGLEAGADDYVAKPFHMEELLARLNALIRRSAGLSSPEIVCGPIKINTSAQQVLVDEVPIDLTAYEYKMLEYMMLHSGRVISKTEITEHIYDQDFDRDSNVIEVFVGRLRKKLDPDDQHKPIETLRGRGYRFSIPLKK